MSRTYEKSYHQIAAGKARKEEVKPPKYYCSTCNYCSDKRCSVFNRYVELDYNKCYYHSNYTPVQVNFEPPKNLKEIMKKEEQRSCA